MNLTAQTLSKTEPFSQLNSNQLEIISLSFQKRNNPTETTLVEQGKQISSVGIIQDGAAKVVVNYYNGEDLLCGYLKKGDMLLDLGLFSKTPATANIICCAETTCLHIAATNFLHLLESYPLLKHFFYGKVASGVNLCHFINCGQEQCDQSSVAEDYYYNPLLYKAEQYIDNNFAKPITLEMVAKETAMSKYHFCRCFKKHFGTSFKQYLNRKRIEAAKKLLTNNAHSVTDVGFTVGFNDASYFSRVFKELEGYPPKQLYSPK